MGGPTAPVAGSTSGQTWPICGLNCGRFWCREVPYYCRVRSKLWSSVWPFLVQMGSSYRCCGWPNCTFSWDQKVAKMSRHGAGFLGAHFWGLQIGSNEGKWPQKSGPKRGPHTGPSLDPFCGPNPLHYCRFGAPKMGLPKTVGGRYPTESGNGA